MKKVVVGILIVLGIVAVGTLAFSRTNSNVNQNKILSPIPSSPKKVFDKLTGHKSELAKNETISILLLGIDRRSKNESSYRTDIMILVSINKKDNSVVMTSIPRDLWWGGGRINAVYIQQGWEGMQQAFTEVTGQKPDRFILTDFEDFSWIVDAMGGVPVDVEITFTDASYPVDETFGYQTVSFNQGIEKMTGERALVFARSRKGDNDNGDWGRMRRQHLILKGMLNAVSQPESTFNPMNVEKAFKAVTTGKMDTNLQLQDAEYLWDLYKDREKYQINSIIMDYEYVYTPPMSEYGGAWVLAPIGDNYSTFHKAINEALYPLEQVNTNTTTDQNNAQTQTR